MKSVRIHCKGQPPLSLMGDSFRHPPSKLGEPPEEPDQAPPPPSASPNDVQDNKRWINGIARFLLLCYATYGLIIDDISIPSKHGDGLHFHGVAAWLVYGGIVSIATNQILLSVADDDKRNNETNYRLFARVIQIMGIAFLCLSMLVQCGSS
jgi:hypothetical protein